MVLEAIIETKEYHGASRQKIANYIKANFEVKAEGAIFNNALRRALKDGMERGVLSEGLSIQRFKITKLGRKEDKEENLSKKYDAEEEEKRLKKEAKKKKAAEAKKKPAAKKKKKTTPKKKSKPKLTARQKAAVKKKADKEKKE